MSEHPGAATRPRVRHISSGACHPAFNLALDEALLRQRSAPALRFYRWDPPGLSLGYFQRSDELAAALREHPEYVLVRRPTGGKAIAHGPGELTFSLVYPETLLAVKLTRSYEIVHEALAAALGPARAEFRREDERALSDRADGPWCFYDSTPLCLLLDGRKLVGSAQRRLRGWVLHHGSIALARDPLTPETAALEDRLPRIDFGELERRLAAALAARLAIDLDACEPTEAELALARKLAAERYSDPEWRRDPRRERGE